MKPTLSAWAMATLLAVSPAYAVKGKKGKVAPKKAAHTQKSIEDEAWGGSGTKAKKPVAKKTVAVKKGTPNPTVQLNTAPPPAAAVVKPPVKPTVQTQPDPNSPTAAATDPSTKSAEDLEKAARNTRDPQQALATYNKLVQSNPNYAYAGDVYANMYNLAVRSHADTLDQLKYAGMAADKMQAGLTRTPATAQQINHFKQLEENLTNKWIQDEIQKIMAGKE